VKQEIGPIFIYSPSSIDTVAPFPEEALAAHMPLGRRLSGGCRRVCTFPIVIVTTICRCRIIERRQLVSQAAMAAEQTSGVPGRRKALRPYRFSIRSLIQMVVEGYEGCAFLVTGTVVGPGASGKRESPNGNSTWAQVAGYRVSGAEEESESISPAPPRRDTICITS
jgi:hypothetical protein